MIKRPSFHSRIRPINQSHQSPQQHTNATQPITSSSIPSKIPHARYTAIMVVAGASAKVQGDSPFCHVSPERTSFFCISFSYVNRESRCIECGGEVWNSHSSERGRVDRNSRWKGKGPKELCSFRLVAGHVSLLPRHFEKLMLMEDRGRAATPKCRMVGEVVLSTGERLHARFVKLCKMRERWSSHVASSTRECKW